MTLVQSIDKVVDWLRESVCPQITLKLPDDDRNDGSYDVRYVNPAAFPLYVPGKDRLPPNVAAPVPSVCVQMEEGNDELIDRKRQFKIRFCLACWNPGEHGAEKWNARKNEQALGGFSFVKANGEDAEEYTRNMEGWRDSFNFMDLVLRELEGTEYINGLRLVKENGIKFGLFTEEGNIWDYYPYWHSWISFTLEAGVVIKTPEIYKNLL